MKVSGDVKLYYAVGVNNSITETTVYKMPLIHYFISSLQWLFVIDSISVLKMRKTNLLKIEWLA